MASEVCPFCGKTYKRLKSHLPHCKATASSKTALTQHHVTAKQTSSTPVATATSQTTPKVKKSTQTPSVTTDLQTKKSKKMSAISSKQSQLPTPVMPLKSVNASSPSQSLSQSSKSLPPSTKKKKQKLIDQIKIPSSATISLISSSFPNLPGSKNKSPRALIEAAKSKQVSKGSVEGTRLVSEDLFSGFTPFLTDHLNTSTTAQTKMNSDEDSVKDASLSRDTKPKDAPKKKVSKKAAESPSTTQTALVYRNKTSARTHTRDLWVDNKGEIENSSESKTFLKSRSDHPARITLQDVKATLRQGKTSNRSSRTNILSQIETVEDLSSLSPVRVLTERQNANCVITAKTLSDMQPSTIPQHAELQSAKNKSLKSEQRSLVPLRVLQPKLTSPAPPQLSGHLSSQVSQAAPCSHTVSMCDGLKAGHQMTELLSMSPPPTLSSSPHPFLLAPPVGVETLRVDEGSTPEKLQFNVRKEGALTQQRLGQVRLRELPEWLACKTPRNPSAVVEMVQRGWQWYHRRYIDVKKGGVGGLGMLLAGYCVLSYIWSYPRIKHDRWRKYH